MQGRRVAVTGLGVVAPCGVGADAFFDGLCGPAPVGPRLVDDFDAELLFERHHELDQVEAVGVEVVAELGVGRDLVL